MNLAGRPALIAIDALPILQLNPASHPAEKPW
jgi:hypothetical protein